MLQDYRRQIFNLLTALVMIGVIAQVVAARTTGTPVWQMLAINAASICCIVLSRWSQGHLLPLWFMALSTLSGCVTGVGLQYLNGGWDGTHLYPLLWVYALVSAVGLYGSWPFTVTVMVWGCFVVVFSKLVCPDLSFGVGADQSWTRVAAQSAWWVVALAGAGYTGRRVIGVTEAAWQAQKALMAAQAKEHAWTAEAERLRLAAATERAQALTDLARTFDAKVRTVVTAVAQTSAGIGARAVAVSDAAGATGERVSRAAALSVAVALDTRLMAQNADQLGGSLTLVRGQARAAAAAAVTATQQVALSDAALHELTAAIGRVGEAISIIGVIADRTKLLSLNATIEAARAGEAGRGFAVVAAEVKLLARRTTGSADEINVLVRAMRRAGENAATALQSIGQSIGEVSTFAEQVRGAADDQAAAVGAITRTIASLNEKTGEVQVQVSDVASSAGVTTDAARAMLEAAAALGRDAGSLQLEAGAFIASVRAA
jgi:methyl-accepting chemotaxis protein